MRRKPIGGGSGFSMGSIIDNTTPLAEARASNLAASKSLRFLLKAIYADKNAAVCAGRYESARNWGSKPSGRNSLRTAVTPQVATLWAVPANVPRVSSTMSSFDLVLRGFFVGIASLISTLTSSVFLGVLGI